jgi:anti-sigma factor RsiW
MTENEDKTVDVHPAALLLPWYVNGGLGDPERREVEEHLATCAACRSELASISQLREQTRAFFDAAPAPSPAARQAVMARLQPRIVQPGLLDRLARTLQDLLAPKWAPAALMLVVVGQFAGLGWLASRPQGGNGPATISRAVPTPAVRLKILFNPDVSTSTLQRTLRELGGRIVDGPGADGAFIVELTPDAPKVIGARIRSLRERPDLVQKIESAPP